MKSVHSPNWIVWYSRLKVVWTGLVTEIKFQHGFTSGWPLNHKPVGYRLHPKKTNLENSIFFVRNADLGLRRTHTQWNLKHIPTFITYEMDTMMGSFTRIEPMLANVARNVSQLEQQKTEPARWQTFLRASAIGIHYWSLHEVFLLLPGDHIPTMYHQGVPNHPYERR